jgi:hypothetical protein
MDKCNNNIIIDKDIEHRMKKIRNEFKEYNLLDNIVDFNIDNNISKLKINFLKYKNRYIYSLIFITVFMFLLLFQPPYIKSTYINKYNIKYTKINIKSLLKYTVLSGSVISILYFLYNSNLLYKII